MAAEQAKRRAALACGIEGGREHVADDLFCERGGIDDQRILAAGLRNQRDRRPLRAEAPRKRGGDEARDLGRAGEHHPADRGMIGKRGADPTVSDHDAQGVCGDAGFVNQTHGFEGDQGRFLGRFADDGVARR